MLNVSTDSSIGQHATGHTHNIHVGLQVGKGFFFCDDHKDANVAVGLT